MVPRDIAASINALLPKIEAILSRTGTPGLSFAVVQEGETVFTHHLGYCDVKSGFCADNQTRYNINSLSKAAIAALVGIEVQRGSLAWDSRIVDLLPEFRSSVQIVQDEATIIDMLSHRTGLASIDAPWLQAHNSILMDRSQTLPFFATLPAVHGFRTTFRYNNWGYEIIGLILEKVAGTSLAQLLHDRLFAPLGMHRTSTSWQTDDDNIAKSYGVLDNLSPVEIQRPQLGTGTLMEAAGGVKSTIDDLVIWYKAWLSAIRSQSAGATGEAAGSVLKQCPEIVAAQAWLPGISFREQTYAAGWARSQLPGQLGRLSQNTAMGVEPLVGAGAASRLVVYHHGSMTGSTSVVNLIPETNSAVIVLQNSLATIDTADFVGQILVEALLDVPELNDYFRLAEEFGNQTLQYMSHLKSELDSRKKTGTTPLPLHDYVGTYRDKSNFFRIDVEQHDGHLRMRFQKHRDEEYMLSHYEDDTFTWWMTHNEAISRGRYTNDYGAEFYLIKFGSEEGKITGLTWAWNADQPGPSEYFTRTAQE